MSQRQPTIRDVARHAGVSVTTVSYVFNGRAGISEATRARVFRSAEVLHYSPNALIRSLQQRRTHVIGVHLWPVGEDPSRWINATLLHGITAALARTEFDLLVYSHRPGRFDAANVSAFLDKRIDGLIWTPYEVTPGHLEALARAALPTVVALYQPVPPGIGHVGVDNRSAAQTAVRHLLELGHRRIGFLGNVLLSDFQERQQGYRQALLAAGGEPNLELVTHTGWPDPVEALAWIRRQGVTAVFCDTDSLALKLLAAAREHGVSVPKQLSIVGFDDVPAAALISPGLTTMRLPAVRLGEVAVERLLELIAGKPADEARELLPAELVIRGTTGPPGAGL